MAERLLLNKVRREKIMEFILYDLRIPEHDEEISSVWKKHIDGVLETTDRTFIPSDMLIVQKYQLASQKWSVTVDDGGRTMEFPFNDPMKVRDGKGIPILTFASTMQNIESKYHRSCPNISYYTMKNSFSNLGKTNRVLIRDAKIKYQPAFEFVEIVRMAYAEYYRLFEAYYKLVQKFKKFDEVVDIYPNVKVLKGKLYQPTIPDGVDENSLTLVKQFQQDTCPK